VVLKHPGAWLPAGPDSMHQGVLPNKQAARPATLRLIPYCAWSNRRLSAMQVWIPYRQG
jgi:DUF1680 family protein